MKLKQIYGALFFLAVLPSLTLALDADRFSVGISYGTVGNFRYWSAADANSGSVINVNYAYDFGPTYRTELCLGFAVDDKVFPRVGSTTYAQTATFLAINHVFRSQKFWPLTPYLKLGTGIAAVNGWWKRTDQQLYINANNILADVNFGIGTDIHFLFGTLNIDFYAPGLFHEMYESKAIHEYINFLTIGYKYQF